MALLRSLRLAVLSLACVAGLLTGAGCGEESSSDNSGSANQGAEVGLTDKINGSVPPGRPTAPKDKTLLREKNGRGTEFQVFRTVRAAGTRAAIHTHPFGGVSCVIRGEMTLFKQGAEPFVAKAGDCYWMPPATAMSASNRTDADTVLLDYFATPVGSEVWQVVEPQQRGLQDDYGDPQAHHN